MPITINRVQISASNLSEPTFGRDECVIAGGGEWKLVGGAVRDELEFEEFIADAKRLLLVASKLVLFQPAHTRFSLN